MNASDGALDDGTPLSPSDSNSASRPGRASSDSRIDLARESPVRLGPLGIEPSLRRIAHDDGREEIVEPRVMQVLVALIRAGGQIVSRHDLMMSCWYGVVVGEDAINRVMGRVRRLADGIGDGEIKLETVTKVGYRLVASREAAAARPAQVASAPDERASICVLPFANLSDDPQQAYFSDGISEDIITDLAKVSALSVVARSTAFTFKGKSIDVPEVARQLGVSHVLEGSVRKAGGRVRISAQLIDGAAGDHVWSERWDRDLTDIFALQDEIAQAVVGALKLKLLPEEKESIERRGTDNADAYNLYLMARQYELGGNRGDVRQSEAIERLARAATDIDPGYAPAWALMAMAQRVLHFWFRRPGDAGLAAAERALEIDPDLAEAHAVRARYLAALGRRDEADAEVEAALRLDPESHEVNQAAAWLRFDKRNFEHAIRYWEKAAMLAESDFGAPGMLVTCYDAIGDVDGARRAARTTLARAEKALAQDPSNGSAMSFGVGALSALGEAERAKDWARRAMLIDPENRNMRYNLACALCRLREAEGALELLAPYFAHASQSNLNHANVDPDLDSLRDVPGFRGLIATAQARLARTTDTGSSAP